MKKFLAIVILLVLLSCSGCGAKDSTSWQEQYDLGIRYLAEGNYEEAVIAFTAAIEIDPKIALAYVGRGDTYLKLASLSEEELISDYYQKAEDDYLTAIKCNPTEVEIYIKIADFFMKNGTPQLANEILQKGYENTGDQKLLDDQDSNTMKWSSLTYQQQEQILSLDRATEEFDVISVHQIISSKEFQSIFDIVTDQEEEIGKSIHFVMDNGTMYDLGSWIDDVRSDFSFAVIEKNSYREAVHWQMKEMDYRVGISHMSGQPQNENGPFKKVFFQQDGRTTVNEGTAANGLRVGTETVTYSDGDLEIYEFNQEGNLLHYSCNGETNEGFFAEIADDYPMSANGYRG